MDYLGWCATDGAPIGKPTAYEHLAPVGDGARRDALARRLCWSGWRGLSWQRRAHERVRAFSTGMHASACGSR